MQLSIALISTIILASSSIEASVFQPPQWRIREFHAPSELGNEEVKDIILAKDGSAWFATMGGGVTRIINGKSIFYTIDDGLISNNIDCLHEDSFGGIWVGTRGGISYIYEEKITSFTLHEDLNIRDDLIDTIAMNSKGEVWFGTGNLNLFYFIPEKIVDRRPVGVWKHALQLEMGGSIRTIAFDEQDNLFAAIMGYGLCKVVENNSKDGGSFIIEIIPCDKKEWLYTSYDMSLEKGSNIWVGGGSEKIAYASTNQVQEFFEAPFLVSSFGEFSEDTVLVGTYANGLYSFQPQKQQWTHILLSPEHTQPYIECIRHTADGAYWIGTREGAYRISKTGWESFTAIPGGQTLRTRTLARSVDGVVYAVDSNEDLYKNENRKWRKVTSLPISEKIPPDSLNTHQSLMTSRDALYYGYNLVQNDEGIFPGKCMKIALSDSFSFQDIPLPDDFLLWSENAQLFVTKNGELWLLYEGGVARWDGERWNKLSPCEERERKNVYCVLEPLEDVFWILGRGWIEIWVNGTGRLLPMPSSYTQYTDKWNRLFDIAEHSGSYWIATDRNGLLKYDGSNWEHFHHKDGLPSEGLQSLYGAKDGTLWVGSARTGVSSFKDDRWITYGVDDGVPNAQVLSILEDASSTIWLDLQYNGVAYYRPTENGPIVWIDSGTKNMLPNERGVFSFDGRDAWNSTRHEDLVYSWRIVSREDGSTIHDWSPYEKDRSITTPRLHSGEYCFEVRAQDKDRNTSLDNASFEFTVQPYFWTTPQFLIPVGFSMFIAVVSLGFWYLKHNALLRSETKYRNLVEKDTLTLLINWDRLGRIVYCNETVERLFGVPANRIIGTHIEERLHHFEADSIERFQKTIERAIQNPDIPQECRLCLSINGREVWISWFFRAVVSPDRKTSEIHGVGVDITQQVKTEKALMQEKMSFREFCDSVQIGVLHLSLDGEILYMNSAMHQVTGALGTSELRDISWRNSEEYRHYIDHILESTKPVSQLMEGYRTNDEDVFHVYLSGMVRDGRIVLMALDFTEQKKLEQRLVIASSTEQERLGRELHDGLGQQLTSLTYLCYLIERKMPNEDNELLDLIHQLNANLHESIQLTRDLSKSLNPASLERSGLRAALEELIQSFSSTYPTQIVLNWDENLVKIDKSHFVHLYRIIREACFNALKHANATQIDVISSITNDRLCISISDDGIGISEELAKGKSKGMGLSIMEYHARLIGCNLMISCGDKIGTIVKCLFSKIKS